MFTSLRLRHNHMEQSSIVPFKVNTRHETFTRNLETLMRNEMHTMHEEINGEGKIGYV